MHIPEIITRKVDISKHTQGKWLVYMRGNRVRAGGNAARRNRERRAISIAYHKGMQTQSETMDSRNKLTFMQDWTVRLHTEKDRGPENGGIAAAVYACKEAEYPCNDCKFMISLLYWATVGYGVNSEAAISLKRSA